MDGQDVGSALADGAVAGCWRVARTSLAQSGQVVSCRMVVNVASSLRAPQSVRSSVSTRAMSTKCMGAGMGRFDL